MELIMHFESDNLGDVTLNMSVRDMTVVEILAALGMAIVEIEKKYDVEINASLIEEVIRSIKNG